MFNQWASNLFMTYGRTRDFGLFAGRTLKTPYLTTYIFFVVFMIYTRFRNVATGCIIQPGWSRVGDPWFHYLKPSAYFMYHEV